MALQFNWACEEYLKRAADASDIKIASNELNKAIDYIEKNNLTKGYTSIFVNTPEDDINFWYKNIKQAKLTLDLVNHKSSELEKTNILIKLRETLTDQNGNKIYVTVPQGISAYPYNKLIGITLLLSIFCLIIFFCIIELYY